MTNVAQYQQLIEELSPNNVTLVAVSKTKPVADIRALYDSGQRDFGENYVQELLEKQPVLPSDIRWHFIGHLQRNKVRSIAPFVHLIHGVDSYRLLHEIHKEGLRAGRQIDCLLQIHIAKEETKFGLDTTELAALWVKLTAQPLAGVRIRGMMGMASFTDNLALVREEFQHLHSLFVQYQSLAGYAAFDTLSMGMSADFRIAVECGSTVVRVGSLLFGSR
ncbi:YggS family pyridoxal phosphate-dependent enzyme [Nostoc ellipsosporum NOK]|nr:YggS family pyridoxal phosphate-dependent enzyme [Nostoc ellipsosporum NOK]